MGDMGYEGYGIWGRIWGKDMGMDMVRIWGKDKGDVEGYGVGGRRV